MTIALLALAGVALLGYALWARLGRSPRARSWAEGGWASESVILFVLPGLGAVLLAAALLQVAPGGGMAELWLALPVALGLLLCAWGLLVLPTPRWFTPPWLRDVPSARRRT